MASATLDVVYIPKDSWEFGWDALVALATFFTAIVALYVGLAPVRATKRAEARKASSLSIVLAAELMTALLPAKAITIAAQQRSDGSFPAGATRRIIWEFRNVQVRSSLG